MKKKKNYRKPSLRKERKQNTVSYVCADCGAKEEIPKGVLEYFDEVNLQQLLFGTHQFTCEKCGVGVMQPEKEPETIVRGFGLYEGFAGLKIFGFKS
jgi:DNA-directed RNA polymerase subunit RPC12/RpoP